MAGLASLVADRDSILVRQQLELGEIVLGFEARNRFEICTEDGEVIGSAAEQGSGFGAMVGRQIFGRCRKATVHIYDAAGEKLGRGEKPFRWFFQRMDVYDGSKRIGAIERKWSWLSRRLVVENAAGEQVMELVGPILLLGRGTFRLMFQGQEVGSVRKKWSGVLREAFSDADTFGVVYEQHVPEELRKILLVATFLIDFTYFENNDRN